MLPLRVERARLTPSAMTRRQLVPSSRTRCADQVRLLPFLYLPYSYASHKNSSAVLARCIPRIALCSPLTPRYARPRRHERALLSPCALDDALGDARGSVSWARRGLVGGRRECRSHSHAGQHIHGATSTEGSSTRRASTELLPFRVFADNCVCESRPRLVYGVDVAPRDWRVVLHIPRYARVNRGPSIRALHIARHVENPDL
jgi:hypothetical protein